MDCPDAAGIKVLLAAALTSAWPSTLVTRSAPCAQSAEGKSSNAKTIRTFLISPLSQARQPHHESWWAVANQCVENPELPGINRNRCRGPALDELCGIRVAYRIFSSFSDVPLVS